MAADRMLRWAAPLSALLIIGCGTKGETDFPTWAPDPSPYVPQTGSANAFDDYALAAQRAEEAGGANLDRVNFFPGHKLAARKDLADAVALVERGTRKPCTFEFTPRKPLEKAPYVRGWRLVGRVFAWAVADAAKAEDFDKAIATAATGSKFGFDLTGGDALTASLGLAIVDDIRRALAPSLDKLSPAQLMKLAESTQGALARRAPTPKTLENEKLNMMLSVQEVQDAFRAKNLDALRAHLGPSAKDGFDYLQGLSSEDATRQIEYFKGFAAEAASISGWAAKAAVLPAKERPKLELAKERPWKRISRHFFGTLEPLLSMLDETVARTRLLIITAELRARAEKKMLPALQGFDQALTIDPYSGRPFILHADDTEFTLYSVGPNLKDDGGETDASYTRPDLLLEQPD
jgi:hypothetical protein